MNLDLLTKLVRLANNNPNDNEANLAARKVCRLIEEGKFNFSNGQPKTAADKINPNPYASGTWDSVKRSAEPQWSSKPPEGPPTEAQKKAYEDLLNFIKFGFEKGDPFYSQSYGSARGGGKSYDQETKGTYDYVEYVDFDPITREYILQDGTRISEVEAYNNPTFRKKYKVRPTEPTRPANPFTNKDDRGFYPGWDIKGQKVKEPKPKRILTCCICGKENETAFVGHPQVYRCLTCDWKEYEEKKEKVK